MKKPKNVPKADAATAGSASGRAGHPEVGSTPAQIEQLELLAHELNNLLDGSIRNVGLARRALDSRESQQSGGGFEDVKKRLDTATFALERMADLVHASMQGGTQALGSPLLSQTKPVTIAEAARHATEVVGPEAAEHRVALAVEIDEDVAEIPAGSMYPVLLNGVRNALESIGRAGGIGRVVVQVRRAPGPGSGKDKRRWVEVEIVDDGEGPPRDAPTGAVFAMGFTSKPSGSGLGLAVSRDLVVQTGGTIELRRRADRSDSRRPGAVLRFRYPEPVRGQDQMIGGPNA